MSLDVDLNVYAKEAESLYFEGLGATAAIDRVKHIREERTATEINKDLKIMILKENKKFGIDKSKETLVEYIRKAKEEYNEVLEEVKLIELKRKSGFLDPGDFESLASELLDEIQLRFNLLYKLQEDEKIWLGHEVERHNKKLIERGWAINGAYLLSFTEAE